MPFGETGVIAKELQTAGVMGGDRLRQEHAPKEPRQHAHGEEEAGAARDPPLPIQRDAAARHDDVDVRVVGEGCAPAVQHRSEADPRPEVLWVGGDRDQRLGRGFEQDAIDHGLVLVGNVGDWRRQRKHHVIVGHGQQFGLAIGQPFSRCRTLALWAVSIAAGIVGNAREGTRLAALDMSAEGRRAAALNG